MSVQCYSCFSENINIKYKKNGYNIYSCNSCSLEFVFPQPSESELEKIYTKSYFDRGDKYSKSNEVNIKNDNKKLSIIKKSRLKGKLLDIGCAKGDFLFLAKKNGFDVTGVEISKAACQSAKSKNLNVYNSDLLSKKFDSNCFDVVTMWDVIEHLKNPKQIVDEIHRILKPGGLIFFSTGDVSSRYARISGYYWHLLTPPQHLFYFSPKSIKGLFDDKKYSFKELVYDGKYVTLGFLFFKAEETFGKIISPFKSIINKMNIDNKFIKINLFDIFIGSWEKKG